MEDLQFEINGLPFGYNLPVRIVDGGFDHGYPTVTTQDSDNPVASGRFFGRERFGGMKWGFTGFINEDDTPGALQQLAALASMWVRERDPGDIDVLRYQLNGQIRRVYGRSRRFSDTLNNKMLVGNIPWLGEFETSDGCTYSDELRSSSVSIIAPATGGFLVPFDAPIYTAITSPRQGTIGQVGGDAPAPFVLEVRGQLGAGAKISGTNWQIVTQRTLATGDVLEVDTTPWGLGVRLNGDPVSGMLSPLTSRLFDARLDPAGDRLTIDGVSDTGLATATVRWHPASTTIYGSDT